MKPEVPQHIGSFLARSSFSWRNALWHKSKCPLPCSQNSTTWFP